MILWTFLLCSECEFGFVDCATVEVYKMENFAETMKLQLKMYEQMIFRCNVNVIYPFAWQHIFISISLDSILSNDQLYHFQKSNQTPGNGLTKNYRINNAFANLNAQRWMWHNFNWMEFCSWNLYSTILVSCRTDFIKQCFKINDESLALPT